MTKKNPNNFQVYIRDENLSKFNLIKAKSDFINWSIKNKLDEYLKQLNIRSN